MKILELELEHFRNLSPGLFRPHEEVNVIWGDNAQGKTNLLEAVWLFTGGRSFRGARDGELVALGQEEAALRLSFYSQERQQEARITLRGGRRSAVLNGVPKRGMAELVGSFCAVIFSPEHLSLVKGGPAERRAFLDSALCQVKPPYASVFARYQHTLSQRNALLKDIPRHPELMDTLSIWDERLCRYGEVMVRERGRYLEQFSQAAAEFYAGISGNREQLSLQYQPSHQGTLAEALAASRREDVRSGHTTAGPHRDDVAVSLSGLQARAFASQGQQRSIVLAMKLAEARLLARACGEEPVVLLDDVLSELDASRQDYLLNSLHGRQVFLTCCEPQAAARLKQGALFHVEGGGLQKEEKTCGGQ
ncbi:MAG TPA: DNA replication/repair protein RecF [Candidatus Caccousia avistercoris]|nr:DNA replication/repair protein RecF [Candidatus Caccousia avistercoris]